MVPEESGRRVPNPLSVVSQWKILDNLRRSLVEPGIFLLFLFGWLILPGGPAAWTAATILVLFLPALSQTAFDFVHAGLLGRRAMMMDALDGFLNASIANILGIAFLAHQALLSLDAVVRTMVRRFITRQRLLQWETAAEAELAENKHSTLDIYLSWTPALVLAVFVLLWFVNRASILAAMPILILWAISKPFSVWLDRPPRAPRKQLSDSDRWLLRLTALRTWRYFAEFSNPQQHWLIPDNVQEQDRKIAPRVSTTNLGLLLNARQVACNLGYLNVPEFTRQTLLTLDTVRHLQRHRGHLLNWYDTESLQPLTPSVISSVDNGNLVASLWTLQQGSLDLLRQPLFPRALADGLIDHVSLLSTAGAGQRQTSSLMERFLRQADWLSYLLGTPDQILKDLEELSSPQNSESAWFHKQAREQIRQTAEAVQMYAPWLMPKYAEIRAESAILYDNSPQLEQLPALIEAHTKNLTVRISQGPKDTIKLHGELLELLPGARARALILIEDLRKIACQAATLADEMDFGFLLNPGRRLFSVAFELEKNQNHPACYDLLASEARIAYFVAIAKDDIPQESWFQLGRPPLDQRGISGLLSWTGTMFEYLMPALWMRLYPNTLLERAAQAAVLCQRRYAAEKGVPWGISESASSKRDAGGSYHYFAFGVPQLAIFKPDQDGPVISPYSTFLSLPIDSSTALQNLRLMQRQNWLGAYGFYEALDFSSAGRSGKSRMPEVVRCWMAHHQGMSLLAIANFLNDEVVQNWFHSHPRVQATELLLQEKMLGRVG